MKRLRVLAVVAVVCVLAVVAAWPGEAGAAGGAGLARPVAVRPQIACLNLGTTYALQSDGSLWTEDTKLSRIDGCAGGDEQWVALASGEYCNLALKSDGSLWTLGVPPTRVGTDSDWVAAASGYDFSVALKSGGSLWSWGGNASGQLGLGDTASRTAPTQITGCAGGDANWVTVASGDAFTIALKSDGSLWAWGANTSSQLGVGDYALNHYVAPRRVAGCPGGDSNWVAVACGDAFTVALKSDGSLWAWGDNSWGQLGQNDTTTRTSPTQVTGCSGGDNNWATVAGGHQSVEAIKSDGSLWAWGHNGWGNLGTGDHYSKWVPTRVGGCPQGDSGWVAVACGMTRTVALRSSGSLWVWGESHDWIPDTRIGDYDWVRSQTPIVATACGEGFTVGLDKWGGLWSWGDNRYAQLGDGTLTGHATPMTVTGCSGGDHNWATVACGRSHTLALKSDHGLWAWGQNGSGELGDGTFTQRLAAVHITGCAGGDDNWLTVAAGGYHSAAVKTDGTLWAWGQNNFGQIGDGTIAYRNAPVQVTGCPGGDTNWVAVACGPDFTIARKSDGTLWACGRNNAGQLGDGTDLTRRSPVQVTGCPGGNANWAAIACGNAFTVALKSDGSLWAWGDNHGGQLGYDTTSDLDPWGDTASRIPQRCNTGSDWVTVRCGASHTVARRSDDTLWAWGNNVNGQLGQGTHDTAAHLTAVQVGTATNWLAGYSAGYGTTVVPASDGCIWGWGANDWGQIGDATVDERDRPVRAPPLLGDDATRNSWGSWLPRAASGGTFSLALKSDTTLWAWGDNSVGELGLGAADATVHALPVSTPNGTNWKSVACGYQHCAGLMTNGSLWTWGADGSGQLGLGDTAPRAAPTQVSGCSGGDTNWVTVACSYANTLALKSDGSLWAWGDNTYGQLGQGGHGGTHSSPLRIGTGNSWASISCGWYHAAAVRSDGTLWAWGYNLWGQLGDGTIAERDAPVQITGCAGGDANWVAVAAGGMFTLGLKSDGSVWAWGSNTYGQLADGTTTSHSAPALISGAGGNAHWIAIACGGTFAAGLKSDGTLWMWGYNANGQLGDGTTSQRTLPVQVTAGGSASDWTSVACGTTHTVVMKSDGSLWAWGGNASGQLGDGAQVGRPSPYRTIALSDIWAPSVLSLTAPDFPDPSKWYSHSSATFTWPIPSDESGVSGYSYAFGSSSSTWADDTIDTTGGSLTFGPPADGIYYFDMQIRDGAYNWNGHFEYAVRIDTTAPKTADNADTLWHSTSVGVQLTASDAVPGISTSGVAAVSYRIDEGSVQTIPSSTATAVVDAPTDGSNDGVHTVTFRAQDNAGNWEAWKSVQVKIDTTPPQVGTLVCPTHPSPSTWYSNASPLFCWAGLDDASAATVDAAASVTGVDASGNVACLVDGARLRVLDLTNPWRPQEIGSVGLDAPGCDVTMAGGFAYVADGEAGLLVVDLADPHSPRVVAGLGLHAVARHVELSGTIAYVATDRGLFTVGLEEGVSPTLLGAYTDTAIHAVAIQGTLAFAATDRGLLVLDVTEPARPELVGECRLDVAAQGVFVSGATALVADGEAGLAVVDVSHPAEPVLVTVQHSAGAALGVVQAGGAAFVANGAGLTVYDVSGSSPLTAGTHETARSGLDVALTGEYALIADGPAGLAVVKAVLTPSYTSVLDGVAGTLPPASGATGGTSLQITGQADGAWYVHVRMCDQAGNFSSAADQCLVRIDTTAPHTTDNADGLRHQAFRLVFTPTDEASGVVLTEYRIDGGGWKTGSAATLRLRIRHKRPGLTRGNHLIEYRSTDAAGNVERIQNCTVKIG